MSRVADGRPAPAPQPQGVAAKAAVAEAAAAAVTPEALLAMIRTRWSPRAFATRPVPPGVLRTLLEAARWAPSSGNQQPWRFVVAAKDDPNDPEAFARALGCLRESNRGWAQHAPVLLLALAQRISGDSDSKTAKENRYAFHDVGLAVATLTLQATAMGLHLHQMGGILRDEIRSRYALPDGIEPVTAIAVGFRGDPERLPDDLREREGRKRTRLPLTELVFAGAFGTTAPLVADPEADPGPDADPEGAGGE